MTNARSSSAPTEQAQQETPWLSTQQQASWRAFLGGTTVLLDQLDRDLRTHHGISMSEYEILVRLSEAADRSIRMAELADALAYSRSRITHTIARLEKMNIVERIEVDTDGRGVAAHLTDNGFSVLETAAHTHVRGVHEYFVSMASDEEFAVIGKVLGSVLDSLDGRSF